MTRTLLVLTVLCLTTACDKNKKDTPNVPGDGGTMPLGDDDGEEPEPPLPDVPQEPDPDGIRAGAHEYLLGHYQESIDTLQPLYDDLKERNQYRASGLAGGWLAVAHTQLVFENAEEPAQHALRMAKHTKDAQVVTVAKMAHGAFLLGNEDFAAAASTLKDAALASPGTLAGALSNILEAEALIGSAFGTGASTTVIKPADLEEAKKAYARAEGVARAGVETNILLGRVEEGRSAISKYQKDRTALCKHAWLAIGHYKKAGASEFLIDGPNRVAVDEKCEKPQ